MSELISDNEMEHLKHLARLELSEEETQALKADLNKTLSYFEQIKELDTEGVEELVRPLEMSNVFREDEFQPSLSHEEATSIATESENGYYKVPRTVDIGQ